MNFKNLLFVFLLFAAASLVAQTTETIFDWETSETSIEYASFGNSAVWGDSMWAAIPNPHSGGINTSATVGQWWKSSASDAKTWGGFSFTPAEVVNFKGSVAQMCIKVWADHGCDVLLKVEAATDGTDPASLLMSYTNPNEWQELCFDFAIPDAQGDVGLGHIYEKIGIFLDFGVTPTSDAQYFFDDLTKTFGGLYVDPDQRMISDMEPDDIYKDSIFAFGNGHLGDSTFTIVANPTPNGYNNSANVHAWCEANDAKTWGGFGIIQDTIDFTGTKAEVCITMLVNHAATIRLQAKGSETGPAVKTEEQYTTPGEWQQVCFDMSKPGNVNDNLGLGHLYTRMDFYLDYGSAQAADDCYYFDNILLNANGTGSVPQLVENLINNNSELSDFKRYVDSTDLWGEINKDGVTVFAPTNSAFAALSSAELDALDNNTDNATYNMVLHHMAYDSLPGDLLTDGLVFHTRNGQDGTVTGTSVNGGNVSKSEEAINGFLHTLDGVMAFPADPESYLYSDFENGGTEDHGGWWNWGTAGLSSYRFIDNPHKEGINTSDGVMEYRKFPKNVVVDGVDKTTLWYQGIAHNHERPYNFFGLMKNVCFDVYAPTGNHMLFLKMDHAKTPNKKTGWFKSYTGGSWETVCFDATDSDWYNTDRTGVNNIFPGTALFFDTQDKEFPADTAVFYVDNWRTENVLVGTNNVSKLENFKMSPNPASDFVDISSDTPIKIAVVYDVTGKIMFSATDPIHNNLNVSALQTGMYFIKFVGYSGETQGAIRFVKQ